MTCPCSGRESGTDVGLKTGRAAHPSLLKARDSMMPQRFGRSLSDQTLFPPSSGASLRGVSCFPARVRASDRGGRRDRPLRAAAGRYGRWKRRRPLSSRPLLRPWFWTSGRSGFFSLALQRCRPTSPPWVVLASARSLLSYRKRRACKFAPRKPPLSRKTYFL